jgi:phosphoglycolate phosphatase
MLQPKKLLIFDLDGTLIDSALDLGLSINLMLKKFHKEPFDEEQIHHWVGNGALMLVQRSLSASREIDPTLDPTIVEEALECFLDIYQENLARATVPYEGVIDTLQQLKQRGYTLALVTNKPYRFVDPLLERLGLDNLFEMILGGDSLSKKKPDPMPLLHVANAFETLPSQTLMVGDSKNDILASHRANMECVGVTYGYNYGEDIDTYNPTVTIDSFSELLKYL